MNPANPIVLHFASGASLFSGAVILLALLALAARLRWRWRRTLRDGAVLLGVALMGLSATPAPVGLIECLAVAALGWIICEHVRGDVLPGHVGAADPGDGGAGAAPPRDAAIATGQT